MQRREFISRLVKVIAGGILAWTGMGRKSGAKPLIVELGHARDYPPGTVKHLIFEDAFLVSDDKGIYALSSVCTHRGGPLFKTDKNNAFVCRRHHSRFDLEGDVVRGPAGDSLPWLKLELTEEKRLKLYRDYRGERGVKIPHELAARGPDIYRDLRVSSV